MGRKIGFSPVILFLVSLNLIGFLASQALAVREFKDAFQAKYIKPDSQQPKDVALAQAFNQAGCAVCHAGGNNKRIRNDYGKQLAKLVRKEDKADKTKIEAALDAVAKLKIKPADRTSPTFGEEIASGKLPVTAPLAELADGGPPQDDGGPGGPGGFGGPGFPGPGGPGPGGPGFGPGGMQGSNLILLGIPAVQQEVGLSEEQKTVLIDLQRKMQEQMRASFGDFRQMEDISQEDRDKRFAEAGKKVEETIKQANEMARKLLTAKQSVRLSQLRLQQEGVAAFVRPEIAKQLDLTEEQQARIKNLQRGFGPQDDLLAGLTAEQKAKWAEMKGKEFQFSQSQGPGFNFGGPGGPGPGGVASGGGGLGSVKSQIRASDEEWKIIEPKLRKVIFARQAVETGMNAVEAGDFGGRRGGFGGQPGQGRGPGGPGGGPGGGPFGRDSFSGPNDVGAGGFGAPGGGLPGFGPPGFGAGPRTFQRGSGRDRDDTPLRSGTAKLDSTQSPDGGKSNTPEAAKPTGATAPTWGPGRFGGEQGGRGGGGPGGFGGGPGGGFGSGPGGGPGGGGRDSAIAQAMAALQTAAADPKTSPDEIKKKVAAVRLARQKARAKLEAAEKELLELLAPDQEAVLVGLGYLN